jgi:molybdopterin-dependent oxidoreductase-like protein
LNSNVILPSSAPYEMESFYINLEGRYRFMKKHIKNFLAIYADWEIINLFKIYNKKKKIINFFFFNKYDLVFKFFYKLIDYGCNYFFTLEAFFLNFFFYDGYKKKVLNLNNDLNFSIILSKFFKIKFLNTVFTRCINNYYSNEFFLKNSKIMAFCATKTFIKF